MNNIKKFRQAIIFLSVLLVVFAIAQLAWSSAYFVEKGREVYVFDNFYIKGYLTIGEANLDKQGKLGDVLVSKEVILDENSSFVFCKDERQTGSNLPLNTDCTNKVLVWSNIADQGLIVKDDEFNRIVTNVIEANTINFNAQQAIRTSPNGVKVNYGCFSNIDNFCYNGQLKSENTYLSDLGVLPDSQGFIELSGADISLGDVELGNANNNNLDRHYICKTPVYNDVNGRQRCGSYSGVEGSWSYWTKATFSDDYLSGRPLQAVWGPTLCCYIKPIYPSSL